MGPFCRASRKLKGTQKGGVDQSRNESSSKRVSLQNDRDQKINVQMPVSTVEDQLEENVNYSSPPKCAIPVTKLHKEAGEGGNKISRRSNMQKEHSQVLLSEVPHDRSKGKLEEDATLGDRGCASVKQENFEVKDARVKGKSGKGCVYTLRTEEVPCPIIPAEKQWILSEEKPDENVVGVSEMGAVNLKEDCKTDSILADKTSDICTSSLTLSLGLNRIKTRLCPPFDDYSVETIRGNPVCSQIVQSPQAKRGAERVDKSQFLHPVGQATIPSRQFDNIARRDSYHSRKDQFKTINESVQHQGAASRSTSGLGDIRSQDGCANNSSRMNEVKNARLQRSLQSPQRSSLVRGSLEGSVTPLNSEVDTGGNFSSLATSHAVDWVQLKSKDSYRKSQISDNIMDKKVPSRFFDNDCSSIAEAESTQINTSVFVNDAAISFSASRKLDAVKETESIRFQVLPNLSEATKKKKGSKGIKSFSHELGPRGKSYGYPRPHSDNDLEELLGALWARFNTAKEDVDSKLAVFAADLVEILDKNADSFPEWQEKMEDLLVLARRCAFMSSSDFRRECESIVRELVARRQDFSVGLLKQLHMRMLFILTQCTRLLQFQKEANPEEEGPLRKVQQCLKGVPSIERTWTAAAIKKGDPTRNIRKLLPDLVERIGRLDSSFSASKHTKKSEVSKNPVGINQQQPLIDIDKLDSHVADCLTLLKNSDSLMDEIPNRTESTDDWVSRSLKDNSMSLLKETWDCLEDRKHDYDDGFQETLLQSSTSLKQVPSVSGGYWSVEHVHLIEDLDSVICRICEEEVPTSHLEAHSFICALADTSDAPGLSLDERLRMLADNLEKISELNTPKSSQQAPGESPDSFKFIKSHEGPDSMSPKLSDNLVKFTDARFEDLCAVDTVCTEEPRGLSIINFKPYLGAKSDQGVASSSAGSGTPRSTLTTPRNSQLDLLWAERSSFTELDDISQMYELADIARCVANKSLAEQGALEYLVACMQDLHDVLGRNRIAALTVDTFGRRIENLLKEKYLLICEGPDQKKVDSFLDDGISTDDGLNSVKSTPTHPTYKDQITIDDFELIKPISRGTFGRVFLARKRTTGDLFAIKVLRKIDMIRKNAVENILAERDILISVRNPFVVRFFYSFTCRENLYLVMEYLNGGDLYSLLRNMGCLEEHVTRVYIAELVLALEYVHSLGVVHRDLKPDNMLIAHDGHIKLTDFGLSKVGLINSTDDLSGPASGTVFMDDNIYQSASGNSQNRERCKNRSAVGTPDYLAPEILLGTEHGYTADWWSTGIILFECLTGLPPFNAVHPQVIFDNILNRKIPWPRIPEEMSNDAQDLIDKLLTEDPNQRLGSKGASEVKAHPFFKDINWDTLARQKAAFVPKPESVDDTSYFTSRHHDAHLHLDHDLTDSSDCSSSSSSIDSLRDRPEVRDDECRDLAELESTPSMEYTFNNFSYKNLSQLASINYDLLSQTGKDPSRGHSRHPSVS